MTRAHSRACTLSVMPGNSRRNSVAAAVIGLPLGAALAMFEFRGRSLLILIANALLGLPPVVVGLALYLLLSRAGPLGGMGMLFTPMAMAVAQFLLALPIVIALSHRTMMGVWQVYGHQLLIDGTRRLQAIPHVLSIGRLGAMLDRGRQYRGLYAHDDQQTSCSKPDKR
jgi:tungstate transport system permease protein